MFTKILNFLKSRAGLIIIAVLIMGLAGAGVVTAMKMGGSNKLSFTNDMITECVVEQSCNLSLYVNNPQNKKLSCVATYTDEFGLETEFQSVGLTFKPTEIGEVHIVVQAEDGESIETDMKVVEAVPQIVTVEERICYLDSTIQFSDLIDNVIYNSYSKPKFEVTTIEFGADKMDMKGKTEYTFTEVGGYTFRFALSNETGSTNGTLIVRVKPEPTEKEKDDLTNGSYIYTGSMAKLGLSKDFHAENSDWAWSIKATPAGRFDTTDGSYWMSGIMIPFDREFDAAKQYFTMDLFANENTAGICIQYINDAGQIIGSPMGYQDVIGEWTNISSRGLVSEGTYGGIQIAVLHKMEGEYDASNVMAYIDNLYIHDIDLNAPIIVGGTEDYKIDSKNKVITWKSKLPEIGNGNGGNYVQFNKKYKNESLIVTMPIGELDKAGVVLGARTSGASVECDKNQGVFVKIFNGFFEVFGPNYWDEKGTLGAEVLPLEKGKTYTFTYSVETRSGKDTLYLKVQDSAGKTVLNYSLELPKGAAPASGNLVVWSRVANMKMQYEGPKVVERKIVDPNAAIKVGGVDDYTIDESKKVITWQSTLQDNGTGNFANYAQFNKKYTNESLTVTMPVGDLKNAGLVLGARMTGADTRCDKENGIFIKFFEGFFEVFGPGYYEEGGALGAEVAPLEKGKTYTFTYSVESASGKDTLYLKIKDSSGKTIVNYTLELPKGVAPASGNLVVWSRVENMTMQYEEPKVVERVVVDPNAAIKVGGPEDYKIDETAKTITWTSTLQDNGSGNFANYAQFNKKYTNELLTVTMPIGDLKNAGLVLGARMSGADTNCNNAKGIFIKFFEGFFEVHGPEYYEEVPLGADVASIFRSKTYTFTCGVETVSGKDILYLEIINSDKQKIVDYELELPANVAPTSGNLVVWTRVENMTMQYEEPKVIERPVEDENAAIKVGGADEYKIDEEKKEVTWTSSLPETSDGNGGNYVHFNKPYTNESLTVTMPVGELANCGLVLGARMSGADVACNNHQGIFIKFFNGFFEVFGPSYFDAAGALGAELAPLEKGKTYTFVYSVETSSNIDTLYLKITDAEEKVIVDYKLELPEGKAPANGNFAVWSRVPDMTLQYEEPAVIDRTPKPEEDNGNTKVKITGIFQDMTKLNVSGHNEIYFTTDQYMTEGTWVFYNDAKKQMHHQVAAEGTVYGRGSDICWSGESYLYIQSYDVYQNGDVIYIPKGMTFTINGVTYEIAETFVMTCSEGTSLTGAVGADAIKINITGFAQWDGAPGRMFYLATDLNPGVENTWKFFHDSGANIMFGTTGAETDICWGAPTWLFIQKSDAAFEENTVVTIPKGLKLTVDGITYEIAEECKYQYSNGTLNEVTE